MVAGFLAPSLGCMRQKESPGNSPTPGISRSLPGLSSLHLPETSLACFIYSVQRVLAVLGERTKKNFV
jgi:hypothetical protein